MLGWLLLVAAVFVAGQVIGTKSLPSNDAGRAGRAEQALERLGFTSPPAESVLIQARNPGLTYPASAQLRQAEAAVLTALRGLPGAAADIRSPGSPGGAGLVSADRRSILVTFQVPGNTAREDAAVVPALRAVAAVQAGPGPSGREAGDASTDRAANAASAAISAGPRRPRCRSPWSCC